MAETSHLGDEIAAAGGRKLTEEFASRMKAVGEPTRAHILALVANAPGALAICDLIAPTGLSQPTVSHHVRVLREAGLIEVKRAGAFRLLNAVPEALQTLAADLASLGGPVAKPKRKRK